MTIRRSVSVAFAAACSGDKLRSGRGYGQLIGDLKSDFNTDDEYQASYLIAQAANELCPAMIWQLRNSAAGYRPAPPSHG